MNPTIPQLRQQIDACRPGSDDLSLPELADLARSAESDRAVAAELDRSQRFDQSVSAALHDAPVPAGLLDRLLAATAPALAVALPSPPTKRRWLSRRAVLSLAAVAAVAITTVTIVLNNLPSPERTIGQDELAGLVEEWTGDVLSGSSSWKVAGPETKSPAGSAISVPPKLWRYYTTPAGESAVVYDCTPSGRQKVLLFVVRTPHDYNVAPLPFSRLRSASKGVGVAAWQKGDMLYVLTVVEDNQRVDHYIRKPAEA